MAGPWEKYAAQAAPQEGPWTKYAAMATPVQPTLKDRLLKMANSATNTVANTAEDAAPTLGMLAGGTIGGAAGAAAGGIGAAPGAIGGAGIGGAAGEAYRKLSQYFRGTRDPNQDTSLGNAGDISRTGLGGMAAEGLGAGVSALAKTKPAITAGDLLAKGGSKVMKIAAAIPERYGEAVLKNPDILRNAMLPAQRGPAYDAFEGGLGLKGLGKIIEESGRSTMPVGEIDSLAVGTANKVRAGTPTTLQELYSASQAENHMMQAARNQEPGAARALESGILKRAGQTVDSAIESTNPEYAALRQGNFDSHAREAFSNVFPQNKNGTANVLRPWAAFAEFLRDGASKTPLLPAVSPAVWGAGIKTASSPITKFLAKYGTAKTAQIISESENEGR